MRNPVVHRVGAADRRDGVGRAVAAPTRRSRLDEHPLLALLDRPNQRQAGASFLEALYGHLLLSGNAYVEMIAAGDEGARELHLLQARPRVGADRPGGLAERAGISRGARGGVLRARGGRGLRQARGCSSRSSIRSTIIYGFAPLEAALMALDIHNAAGRWNKALLDNSARPSGALVYAPKEGGNLSDEQFDRLKAELEDGYSGAARAGRPLLLEGGLDWKAMGLTPKDMDFIEAKRAAARDIALAFGVPPMLLGIPGDNTYANYQEANRAFYRADRAAAGGADGEGAVGVALACLRGGLKLWYDADQVEGLTAERDALWTRVGARELPQRGREARGGGVWAAGWIEGCPLAPIGCMQ